RRERDGPGRGADPLLPERQYERRRGGARGAPGPPGAPAADRARPVRRLGQGGRRGMRLQVGEAVRRRRAAVGFTLLEIAIAMAILGVGIVTVLQIFGASLRLQDRATRET